MPNLVPALEVHGLVKAFNGQRVLDRVDFSVASGEIHALLGENGAGKSTLIKVVAGIHRADAGRIMVAGNCLPAHHGPADAARHGVQFVHQDLGLIDRISVAENVALGAGYARRRGLISFRATERQVAGLLERAGCNVPPRALVGDLAQAEKVLVAVARAFSAEARLIVLDEVTASLPGPEVTRLTAFLRRARQSGVGFVFVTHRLSEIFGLADRVTVLRDGKTVACAAVDEVTQEQIVHWIVGHAIDLAPPSPVKSGEDGRGLQISDLYGPGLAGPVSFSAGRSEVIALTGLIGCGAREVVRLLAGAAKPFTGTASLDGIPLPIANPTALNRAGVSYVPGDRHAEGAALDMTIRENLFLARLGAVREYTGLRDPRGERNGALALMERFDVRPADNPERPVATLSGGNQQKIVVGRALHNRPRLLLLDDPTMGVDVGARAGIYKLLRQAAELGTTIVFASSDFDEVVGEASRALVFRRGRIACELAGGDLTRDRLVAESY